MLTIVLETREQKIKRYRKMKKRQLAEMLFNANEALAALTPIVKPVNANTTTFVQWPGDVQYSLTTFTTG